MTYYHQVIIATYINELGIEVTVREGLNYKDKWELRLVIPKELWNLWDTQENFIYEQRGPMYFAEDKTTGRVSYFFYDKPGRGFGGAQYKLNMIDGTTTTLYGPWSSNSHAMNTYGFEPSKEVNIRGRYNMADAMSLKAINKLLKPLEMECILIDNNPYIIRL